MAEADAPTKAKAGSGVEVGYGGYYGLLFVFAEFGVDGEGEDFLGGSFGDGEVAGLVAEVGEGLLLVEGEGVVDLGADAVGGEVGAEVVAARGADDVLVEDMGGAGVGPGEDHAVGDGGGVGGGGHGGDACGEEELVVAGGELAAALVPGGEVLEFHFKDGGLQGVEAGVPAELVMEVAAAHAVGAQHAAALLKLGGAGGEEASIAKGGEILGWVEGEGGGVSEGSGGGGGAVR